MLARSEMTVVFVPNETIS